MRYQDTILLYLQSIDTNIMSNYLIENKGSSIYYLGVLYRSYMLQSCVSKLHEDRESSKVPVTTSTHEDRHLKLCYTLILPTGDNVDRSYFCLTITTYF